MSVTIKIKQLKAVNCIIVIPVYKSTPLWNEDISFTRCIEILSGQTICIITHRDLDISYYSEVLNKAELSYKIKYFDKKYFKSLRGYNQLMLSCDFYKRFSIYEYMLIYQLDAYVFRDELEYWCKQRYDYIGAPWFEGWHDAVADSPIIGVGNGGFSLRRTRSMIRLLKTVKYYEFTERLIEVSKLDKLLKNSVLLSKLIRRIIKIKRNNKNEDLYIYNLSLVFRWFKIAPSSEALRFSFDANPEVLYKLNNNKLPFGCHAWERYNPNFWSQFINN